MAIVLRPPVSPELIKDGHRWRGRGTRRRNSEGMNLTELSLFCQLNFSATRLQLNTSDGEPTCSSSTFLPPYFLAQIKYCTFSQRKLRQTICQLALSLAKHQLASSIEPRSCRGIVDSKEHVAQLARRSSVWILLSNSDGSIWLYRLMPSAQR